MELHDNFKEKIQMDMKGMKTVLDMNIKMMSDSQDNIEKRIKEFCYNILNGFEKGMRDEISSIRDSFGDIKMENGKYHREAMSLVKDSLVKIEELNEMKVELDYTREKDAKLIENNNKLVEDLKAEFMTLKQSHKDVNEALKDMRKKHTSLQALYEKLRYERHQANQGDRADKDRPNQEKSSNALPAVSKKTNFSKDETKDHNSNMNSKKFKTQVTLRDKGKKLKETIDIDNASDISGHSKCKFINL